MTQPPQSTLEVAADQLTWAVLHADELADCVQRLEHEYEHVANPAEFEFYVKCQPDGRSLKQPLREARLTKSERHARERAIEYALKLRESVDTAITAVAATAQLMDDERVSVNERWSVRVVAGLRALRGAILRGHSDNYFPSALPMIRAGVPSALREHRSAIAPAIESLKSAIAARIASARGTAEMSVDQIVERAVAAGLEAEMGRQGGKEAKGPKTRRGLAKLSATSIKDMPVIAALKAGQSYRAVATEYHIGKSTVARIAKQYGLTGHVPDSVPLEGTLEENLTIRDKPRKRGKS